MNEFVIKNGFISKGDSSINGSVSATTYYGDGSNLTGISGLSELLVNKTLYVDGVNGDDTTAIVGDMSKPFATITSAKTSASVGDLIHVRPATYQEDDITKDGVAMYFDKGAIVHPTNAQQTTSQKSIIDVSAYTNKLVILGYGEFISDYSGQLAVSCIIVSTDEAYIEFYKCDYTSGSNQGVQKGSVILAHTGVNNTFIECKGDIYKTDTNGGGSWSALRILQGNIQFVGNVYNISTNVSGTALYVAAYSGSDFKGIGNIYCEGTVGTSIGLRMDSRGKSNWIGNIEVGVEANTYAYYTESNYSGMSSLQGHIKGAIWLSLGGAFNEGSYISGLQDVYASPNGYAITCNDNSHNIIDLIISSNTKIFNISNGLILFQGIAQTLSANQQFINCTGGKFVFNGSVNDHSRRLTNSTITGGEVVISSDFESWGSNYPSDEYVFYVDGGTLRVEACKIENHQTRTGSGVIEYVSGNLILNGATLVAENTSATSYSVKVTTPLNYLGYNNSFANLVVGGGGSLTNLITGGGTIIVDTDVE